jgi:hypothetical protein
MKQLLLMFALVAAALAQTGGTASSGAGAQAAAPGTTAPATTARNAGAAATAESFSAAVVNDLVYQFAEGMESRNARLTLRGFDRAKFAAYGRFSDQVQAWFRDHSSCRVYYKLRQTSVDGGRGIALVDFEYEAQPNTEGSTPVRRQEQMRFTFERGPQGWKIVDLSPRGFFS